MLTDKWVTVPVTLTEEQIEAACAWYEAAEAWSWQDMWDALRHAAPRHDCEWAAEDDELGMWSGSCGAEWQFVGGDPAENEMNYCPYCGGKLRVKAKEAV